MSCVIDFAQLNQGPYVSFYSYSVISHKDVLESRSKILFFQPVKWTGSTDVIEGPWFNQMHANIIKRGGLCQVRTKDCDMAYIVAFLIMI